MYPPAEISSRTVTEFSFHARPGTGEVTLNAELETDYGTPQSGDSRTGLIRAVLSLRTDDPEDYRILFAETLGVTFEKRPDDFKKALQAFFKSDGMKAVSDDLDKALAGLDRPPIKIGDSASDRL